MKDVADPEQLVVAMAGMVGLAGLFGVYRMWRGNGVG